MIVKNFKVRKHISKNKLDKFKGALNSYNYNVEDIYVEKNESENYDIMFVKLEDNPIANDLVVHVMAEFKPEG
ncbi:hypothetical protein [Staphylococcus haemolyticus]|uniref:hypothetical protein n=1 Tax=Staphylococcus haemolyticus TaxID=1283 RepID=UPI003F5745FE